MPSGATSRSSIRRTSAVFTHRVLLLCIALVAVPRLGAQARLDGIVARVVGSDTLPVTAGKVVLHRLSRSSQGPVDSVQIDHAGRFRIPVRRDTSAVYILSTRHHGIEYFSSPIADVANASGLIVVVSDTSSRATVGIRARYLLVSAPKEGGGRELVDVFVLRNETTTTRVAADSAQPTWAFAIPSGVERTSIDEGTEVSQDAVMIRNDSVLVFAPLAPGSRQIVLTHFLDQKARRLAIPFSGPVDTVTVLSEEPATRVTGALKEVTQRLGQQSLRGWVGAMAGGETISLIFPALPTQNGGLLAVMVGVTVLVILLGFVRLRRRTAVRPSGDREGILGELAALDLQYAGREPETPPNEWSSYLERREKLKRVLAGMLDRSTRIMLLLLALLSSSCGQDPPPTPAAIEVLDDAGDRVILPAQAERIVSLMPSTTELLFAIGAGGHVVGRTTWCDWPVEALDVPSLGDGLQPSVELILSVRPDLVILYQSAQNALAARRLRELGIPTVQLRVDRLDDLARATRLLGTVVGRSHAADSLLTTMARELEAARRTEPDSIDVLLLAWDQPPIVIGSGSFLHEVLTLAGGRNVFADLELPSGPVSLEAIVARDPTLILATTESPSFASRAEWQVVGAVRERRFLLVSGTEFARPTPRAPAAVRQLALRLDEIRRR